MTRVIGDMSMSLDGYVTGPNDSRQNPFGDGAGILHGWIFDAATDADRAILQAVCDSAGISGRWLEPAGNHRRGHLRLLVGARHP